MQNPTNALISFALLISIVGGSFYLASANAPAKLWTGITEGGFLTPEAAEVLGLEQEHGFLIFTITESSPADRAGLRGSDDVFVIEDRQIPIGGDIIVSMDGRPINVIDDVCGALGQKQVGDSVRFGISRDGSLQQANVFLEELPPGATTTC